MNIFIFQALNAFHLLLPTYCLHVIANWYLLRCGYAGGSLEVKIETDGNDAMEIKTEADRNDIAECIHGDLPPTGTFYQLHHLHLFVSVFYDLQFLN